MDLKATELKRAQSEITNQGINASLQDVLSKQNELTATIHSEATKEKDDRAAEKRREEDAKKKTPISKAKLKLNKVRSDLDDLEEESSEIALDEWKDAEDISISRALKKLEKWEKVFERIQNNFIEVQEVVAIFDLTEEDLAVAETEIKIQHMASDLKEAKNTIIEEDNLRGLYSLDINKPDPIKLPTFSGLEGEDYLDFKEKILKGFVQNRITRADKLAKLGLGLKCSLR